MVTLCVAPASDHTSCCNVTEATNCHLYFPSTFHYQGVTSFTDLTYEEFAKQYLMAPQAVPSQLRKKQRRRRGRCVLAETLVRTAVRLLTLQLLPSQLCKRQRHQLAGALSSGLWAIYQPCPKCSVRECCSLQDPLGSKQASTISRQRYTSPASS